MRIEVTTEGNHLILPRGRQGKIRLKYSETEPAEGYAMQVQAKWEDGILRPLTPLTLRHAVVTIQVPDDEVVMGPAQLGYELSPEAQVIATTMMAELDAIRAAPLPPDEEMPPLSIKQQERMAAFALR